MPGLFSRQLLLILTLPAAVNLVMAPPALSAPANAKHVSSPETAAVQQSGPLKAYLSKTATLLEQNDFHLALWYADLILKKDPSCGQAYLYRGYALYKLEKPEEAAKAIRQGLEILPNYGLGYSMVPKTSRAFPYHILACALQDCDKDQEAIKSIDKALTYCKNDPELYGDRGSFYARLNKNDQALADYTAMIKADPARYGGYFNRARIYLVLKRPKEAVADLNVGIRLEPKESYMYGLRADAYKQLGRQDLAKKDYDKANELGSISDYAQ